MAQIWSRSLLIWYLARVLRKTTYQSSYNFGNFFDEPSVVNWGGKISTKGFAILLPFFAILRCGIAIFCRLYDM